MHLPITELDEITRRFRENFPTVAATEVRQYGNRVGVIVEEDYLLVIEDDSDSWFFAYAPYPMRPHDLSHYGEHLRNETDLRNRLDLLRHPVPHH